MKEILSGCVCIVLYYLIRLWVNLSVSLVYYSRGCWPGSSPLSIVIQVQRLKVA